MQSTFENTYPKYPFAPLVELGIALASVLIGAGGDADRPAHGSGTAATPA